MSENQALASLKEGPKGLGPPAIGALLPLLFWGEGSPKIDYRTKGTNLFNLSTGGPKGGSWIKACIPWLGG